MIQEDFKNFVVEKFKPGKIFKPIWLHDQPEKKSAGHQCCSKMPSLKLERESSRVEGRTSAIEHYQRL